MTPRDWSQRRRIRTMDALLGRGHETKPPPGMGRRGCLGLGEVEPASPPGLALQLARLVRGKQMRVQKISPNQGLKDRKSLIGGVVLGDVPGGVPPNKPQVRSCLQCDGSHQHILQARVRTLMPRQGQLDQGMPKHRFTKQDEKALAGVR